MLPLSSWKAAPLAAALWGAAGAGAETKPPPALVAAGEALPSRLVLCQREVALAAGAEQRQPLLRTCLARRLEAERLVERDCKREVASVPGAAPRREAQRRCELKVLALPTSELPKRPPPPAVVAASAPESKAPAKGPAAGGAPVRPAAGEL